MTREARAREKLLFSHEHGKRVKTFSIDPRMIRRGHGLSNRLPPRESQNRPSREREGKFVMRDKGGLFSRVSPTEV
jgi:hypothetical protein